MLKEHAESYFVWKLIGHGYVKSGKVVDVLSNVGDGPGFRIKIKSPDGHKNTLLVRYKDVK